MALLRSKMISLAPPARAFLSSGWSWGTVLAVKSPASTTRHWLATVSMVHWSILFHFSSLLAAYPGPHQVAAFVETRSLTMERQDAETAAAAAGIVRRALFGPAQIEPHSFIPNPQAGPFRPQRRRSLTRRPAWAVLPCKKALCRHSRVTSSTAKLTAC